MTDDRTTLDLDLLARFVDGELDTEAEARARHVLARSPAARRWVGARRALLERLATLPESQEPERDLWPGLAARLSDSTDSAASGDLIVPPPTVGRDTAPASSAPAGSAPASSAPASTRRTRWAALAASLSLALGLGFWLGRSAEEPAESEATAPGRAETVRAETVRAETQRGAPALTPAAATGAGGDSTRDPSTHDAATRHAMSGAEQALVAVKRDLRRSLDAYRDELPAATVRSLDANLETIDRSITELRHAIEAHPESTELRRALLSYHESEIALLHRVTRAASRL